MLPTNNDIYEKKFLWKHAYDKNLEKECKITIKVSVLLKYVCRKKTK